MKYNLHYEKVDRGGDTGIRGRGTGVKGAGDGVKGAGDKETGYGGRRGGGREILGAGVIPKFAVFY